MLFHVYAAINGLHTTDWSSPNLAWATSQVI